MCGYFHIFNYFHMFYLFCKDEEHLLLYIQCMYTGNNTFAKTFWNQVEIIKTLFVFCVVFFSVVQWRIQDFLDGRGVPTSVFRTKLHENERNLTEGAFWIHQCCGWFVTIMISTTWRIDRSSSLFCKNL